LRRWVRDILIVALLVFPVVVVSLNYLEDVAETSNQMAFQGAVAFVSNLPRRVVDVAAQAGYAGIFALMLLEAAAFPVPSEIILPFAGFMVSQGILDFWPVVIFSTMAALIGSFVDYYVGWRLGPPLLASQSKITFIDSALLRRVGVWFDRYGPVAVALFRLVPAARVLISFPAGIYRMSKWRFAIYTLAGCLPWNIVLVYLGWWLGSSWEEVVAAFRYINVIAYALLILFVVWVGWKLTAKSRKIHLQ
jgi:membrane protein DedA with SNARE-associated domain